MIGAVVLGLGCAIALLAGARSLWNALHIAFLEDLSPPPPPAWPSVSVLAAARDEAAHIETAARTLLAQDYPDFELILVDDRSTDGTGEILDRLAAADPRLRALHVRELPEGWLGKPHALHLAAAAARGQWLLFTDADVHFAPGLLRRTLALAEDRALDHLSLGPRVAVPSLPMALVTGTVGMLLTLPARPRRDGTLAPGPSIGIGAFNLVRSEALRRTEGLEWLRMEVGDDMGLALLVRRHGARAGFALARGDVSVEWYRDFRSMLRGLEKNIFGGAAGFSYLRLALLLLLFGLWAAAPLAALLHPLLWPLGAAAYGLMAAAGFIAGRRARQDPWGALLWPLGLLLMGAILLRSAWHCLRHAGIVWRGTHYPLALLRAGRRLGQI